jgi:hypothetical protein
VGKGVYVGRGVAVGKAAIVAWIRISIFAGMSGVGPVVGAAASPEVQAISAIRMAPVSNDIGRK